MKKFFIALMLCMISTIAYCEIISLTNGWSKFYDQAFMNNEIEGRYSVKIDDKTQFGFYIDITEEGDTLCTLKMENWEEKGQKKIYYFFEDKATYYFNVFRNSETQRVRMVSFSYDEYDDFTTGFNAEGLGQNRLALQCALDLLNGYALKLICPKNMEEFQELKELTIPGIK